VALRDLAAPAGGDGARLAGRYSSLRAHVIGVPATRFPAAADIENELNSANDNPWWNAEHGRMPARRAFYGAIAFAMDCAQGGGRERRRSARPQMALLVDAKSSHGLPRTSAAQPGGARDQPRLQGGADLGLGLDRRGANSPCGGVFSRSTESHNQDK